MPKFIGSFGKKDAITRKILSNLENDYGFCPISLSGFRVSSYPDLVSILAIAEYKRPSVRNYETRNSALGLGLNFILVYV